MCNIHRVGTPYETIFFVYIFGTPKYMNPAKKKLNEYRDILQVQTNQVDSVGAKLELHVYRR